MASFTRQEALDYHRLGRPGKIQIADGMSTEDFADIICGQWAETVYRRAPLRIRRQL